MDGIFAAADFPLAPRCNDFDVWLERIGGNLEPDLIVALPGRPVGDPIGTGRFGCRAGLCGTGPMGVGDPAPAQQQVAVVERGALARGHGELRVVEGDPGARALDLHRRRGGNTRHPDPAFDHAGPDGRPARNLRR